MSVPDLISLIAPIAEFCAGKDVDTALMAELNRRFPGDGPDFAAIAACLAEGIDAGDFCGKEAGGIRFSRPAKPSAATFEFSVDVVAYGDLAGPHHIHPTGEIDMIVPVDEAATFDGHGRGWLVHGPGSGHRPTIAGGMAIVLYLLPQGAIQFTGA
ncbi:DUF4863 family protein [Magnetospirillum moscoviense]|uniref:2-hydroxylaminobenzoate mutase n=1 Tax=Magnetospirillum moscoviense TaxID=1437059 RepID=A0A178MYJ7_9PROT|nr:DUF4863 family protein [Magnetospirillum moscoviense]MBF0324829.1 DUF4863 family protein [Alphaproteobacteria bacterium]OAN63233.1 2-hydroxylaminobenzoate mutase [Magnetospirillum moscoviense]